MNIRNNGNTDFLFRVPVTDIIAFTHKAQVAKVGGHRKLYRDVRFATDLGLR